VSVGGPAVNANVSRHMNEPAAKAALVAVACGALAVTGFALALRLAAFAPCRVLYRIPQAVQDSLACHIYSAISLASLLFVVAAVASGVTAAVFAFFRRTAIDKDAVP
jgi:hypothetical protein